MRFIKTDRGDYVSRAAIGRVEREAPAREAGKPDNRVRVFRLYDQADELLGSVRVLEDRMDIMLSEIIPAQPGEKVITLHFDDQADEVWHQERSVIAWAFRPGTDSPDPITPEGVIDEAEIKVLFVRPDGKLDDLWDRDYESLDAAKAYFLKSIPLARRRDQAAAP